MSYLSEYSRALLNSIYSQVPAFGRIMVVCNATSDTGLYHYQTLQELVEPQDGRVLFFTSIQSALDECQTNNNDIICLDANTSHKVTAQLAITKNRIHFFGFDGGGRKIGSRALISNTGIGATGDIAMVYNTGTGNTFHNISFKNNWTVAQNLYSVKEWGIQTYYENCDISNLGSAHLSAATAASLNLAGNEVEFKNCTIGQQSTLITSTAGQVVLISNRGSSGTKCTRSRFDNCRLQTYTSDTTHVFVRAGAVSIDKDVTLDNCEYANCGAAATGGVTLAVAVATDAGVGGNLFIGYPRVYRATQVATAAVGDTNVYLVSPTCVNTNAVGLVAV